MSESQKPPQNPIPETEKPASVVDPVSKKPDRTNLPPASKYAWTMFLFHPVPVRSKKNDKPN